jgi:sodium-coupled monocarboxylate transporter 8/12
MGAFAFPISAYFFVPIFYRLGATSVYEYFEHRFQSKFLRRLTALIFIVNTIFYMGVVVYAPAVALAGVTELGTWPMILVRL